MTGEEIEEMVRELIAEHLADDDAEAALKWLDERVEAYQVAKDHGLLEDEEEEET